MDEDQQTHAFQRLTLECNAKETDLCQQNGAESSAASCYDYDYLNLNLDRCDTKELNADSNVFFSDMFPRPSPRAKWRKSLVDNGTATDAVTQEMPMPAVANWRKATNTPMAPSPKKHTNLRYGNRDNRASSDVERIIEEISNGYRVLVLMRGAPGSGKSYLATEVVARSLAGCGEQYAPEQFIFTADDYFFNKQGQYSYRVDQLSEAHRFNQSRVQMKAQLGWSPLIVDNTNMMCWEMLPYVQIAMQYGYMVEVLEPRTPWCNSAGKLAGKNQHGVPRVKIQHMLDKYERASVADLLQMLNIPKYKIQTAQLRIFPPLQQPSELEFSEQNSGVFKSDTRVYNELRKNEKRTPGHVAAPKPQREHNKRAGNAAQKQPESSAASLYYEQQQSLNMWQRFANSEPDKWQPSTMSAAKKTAKADVVVASESVETPGKSLMELLVESWAERKEEVSQLQQQEQQQQMDREMQEQRNDEYECSQHSNTLERHSIDCPHENTLFASLRQIYPNKRLSGLWDLFVKCSGNLDWTVDVLLKEDDLALGAADFGTPSTDEDTFACDCGKRLKSGFVTTPPKAPLATALPVFGAGGGVTAKPQRQRQRNMRGTNRQLPTEAKEIKETVENLFILGEEHNANAKLKKTRDMRNSAAAYNAVLKKTARVSTETQTDALDEEPDSVEDDDELLELSIGSELVCQLSEVFKTETTMFGTQLPTHLDAKIFIPRSRAKELFLLWLESAYNCLEEERLAAIRDDEDFARLLKNPKYEQLMSAPTNADELLSLEAALSMQKDDDLAESQLMAAYKHEPPNLAAHLTQLRLCEIYPHIPRETLLDIMAAHDNSYHDTVALLNSSMDYGKESPISVDLDQSYDGATSPDALTQATLSGKTNAEELKKAALRDFEESRNYAAHHSQLKAECYRKAKEAIQGGNSAIALYYSQVARLHKDKIDMYNQRAASNIVEVHKHTQNNPDLLDLHYLYVMEAVSCLDIFIDQHIIVLRKTYRSYKHVFVITGRGLHSSGGVSTIKTKVKTRLKDRGLRWIEINPGLLRIKIYSTSLHSKNI